MVSFGTINFNELKGSNSVPSSGPYAWKPKRHKFVWGVNNQLVDEEARNIVMNSFSSLFNSSPQARGSAMQSEIMVNLEQPKRNFIKPPTQSVRHPVTYSQKRDFGINFASGLSRQNIQWNLFKKTGTRKGCRSCGSR